MIEWLIFLLFYSKILILYTKNKKDIQKECNKEKNGKMQ